MQKRIIIAGSRDFSDYELLKKETKKYADRDSEIVSGTARGADRLGERFAAENELNVKRFPANWEFWGKRAGYIRNEQMARYASEDGYLGVLVAFWDGASRGTKSMIQLANRYNLEVHIVRYDQD